MLNFAIKRQVKIIVSIIYLSAWNLIRLTKRLYGHPSPEYLTILYYHAVPSHQKTAFAKQMAALQRSVHVVAADYQGSLPTGKKYVALTFDDAFSSVYENALPILATFAFPATIFVPVGFIGLSPSWFMGDDHCDRHESVMTAAQLKACPAELVTLGSHSMSHPRLSQISTDCAREEIEKSGQKLSALIGREVELIAFPYGNYDSSSIEICKSGGYRLAFTISSEHVDTLSYKIVRGRTKVDPTDTPIEFYLKFSGAYAWVSQLNSFLKRLKRNNPRPQEVTEGEKIQMQVAADPNRLTK